MQLGLVKAFRPFPDDVEALSENREPLIDAVRFVAYFGNQGEETRLPESRRLSLGDRPAPAAFARCTLQASVRFRLSAQPCKMAAIGLQSG